MRISRQFLPASGGEPLVPTAYVGRRLWAHISFYADQKKVAEHAPAFGLAGWQIDPLHYLELIPQFESVPSIRQLRPQWPAHYKRCGAGNGQPWHPGVHRHPANHQQWARSGVLGGSLEATNPLRSGHSCVPTVPGGPMRLLEPGLTARHHGPDDRNLRSGSIRPPVGRRCADDAFRRSYSTTRCGNSGSRSMIRWREHSGRPKKLVEDYIGFLVALARDWNSSSQSGAAIRLRRPSLCWTLETTDQRWPATRCGRVRAMPSAATSPGCESKHGTGKTHAAKCWEWKPAGGATGSGSPQPPDWSILIESREERRSDTWPSYPGAAHIDEVGYIPFRPRGRRDRYEISSSLRTSMDQSCLVTPPSRPPYWTGDPSVPVRLGKHPMKPLGSRPRKKKPRVARKSA